MKAAWYERQGSARETLVFGEMPDPRPGPSEVRIRIAASGINPGDTKKRQNAFGYGMPYPRIIPHSDGAGVIAQVGQGVANSRIGERVWCYGAQTYRPFGTAAEYVLVPSHQAVPLPEGRSFEQGACLGIPGITAHRCVHVAGTVEGRVVLVQGGAGTVGQCAVHFARRTGARVIATTRSEGDEAIARRAGAQEVVHVKGVPAEQIAQRVREYAPGGVNHIVEVAFDSNIAVDVEVLAVGGSIATYATGAPQPDIPFWELLFKNIQVYFLGSDDFPADAKTSAALEINAALESSWAGFESIRTFDLADIAIAHECVESPTFRGRVVVTP